MTPPETKGSGKVSLEELLRLKRAERPAPEFWARFEQDLRTKQLAAIVEKRPWWVSLRLPQAGRTLARWQVQLPLGAAAALVVGLAVVGERREGVAPLTIHATPPASAIARESAMAAASIPVSAPALAAAVSPRAAALVANLGSNSQPPATAALAEPVLPTVQGAAEVGRTAATAAASAPAPQPAVLVTVNDRAEGLRAADAPLELPAVAFANAVNGEPAALFDEGFALDLFGLSAPVAEVGAVSGRAGAAPASAREVRRERIRASLVLAAHGAERDQAQQGQRRDVLARALDDERGYDGAGRIGMGGDRLILKF